MRRIDISDRWHERYTPEQHQEALDRLFHDLDRLGPHMSHLYIHPAGKFVQTCLYCGRRFDEPTAYTPCPRSPSSSSFKKGRFEE